MMPPAMPGTIQATSAVVRRMGRAEQSALFAANDDDRDCQTENLLADHAAADED